MENFEERFIPPRKERTVLPYWVIGLLILSVFMGAYLLSALFLSLVIDFILPPIKP